MTTTYPEALRKLADVMDANLDLFEKVRVSVSRGSLSLHAYFVPQDEQKVLATQLRRIFGGSWTKDVNGTDFYIQQRGTFDYFSTTIFVARDAVCERKVIGIERVEHAAQPAREAYVEARDIVEWDCGNLLGDAA